MITTIRECREFRRMIDMHRRQGLHRRVNESFAAIAEMRRNGQITGSSWSIRTLFETLVPGGDRLLREMELNRRAGMRGGGVIMEAGDTLTTADFSNIIGQITYGSVMEQLNRPGLIGRQLYTEVQATTQGVEQIPGVTMLPGSFDEVGEGEDYPKVGIGEHWVVAPRKYKKGFIIEATEETLYEDRTSLVQQQMNRGSEAMAIDEERETLDTVCGIETSYIYKDNAPQATYADSHTGFTLDNLIANNALVDYTDLDVVEQHFDSVVDPGNGEPVDLSGGMQIVHPKAIKASMFRTLRATQVRQGAISADAPETHFPNPLTSEFYNNYTSLSNQYVAQTTGSDSTYFVGDFKRAFERRIVWPTTVEAEDRSSSTAYFERDVMLRLRVRRKSAMAVVAPWYVAKCTG